MRNNNHNFSEFNEAQKSQKSAMSKLSNSARRKLYSKYLRESESPEPTELFNLEEHMSQTLFASTIIENEKILQKKTTLNKSKSENFNSKAPIAFDVMEKFLSKYTIVCVEGRIMVYDDAYGCFNERTDRELSILIRGCIPEDLNTRLDRVKMLDVIHRLQSNPNVQIDHSLLDRDTHVINFRNGVYKLETKMLVPHSPDWRLTSYINSEFKRQQGQVFWDFLNECTGGDLKKMESLQEITGYIISNEWRAKKFFALIGLPHTGKSVWLSIWKDLIGTRYTTSVSLSQLGKNRFMTAELLQSKLNISAETDEKGLLGGIDIIKMITGGDMITGERKGKDPFHFYPKTKLVIAGNQMPLPDGADSSDAFLDRILFCMFDHQVPEPHRDKELIPKLLNEKNAIVLWAIEGLQRLRSNNFIFTESDSSVTFRKAYRGEKNSIHQFINDKCDISQEDVTLREHRKTLLVAYRQYCKLNCLKAMSEQALFNHLTNLGLQQQKFRVRGSSPLRGFLGIQLIEEQNENKHVEKRLANDLIISKPFSLGGYDVNMLD